MAWAQESFKIYSVSVVMDQSHTSCKQKLVAVSEEQSGYFQGRDKVLDRKGTLGTKGDVLSKFTENINARSYLVWN